MKIQSGGRDFSLCFTTPTWGPDLGHFRWLRRSLERAGLADVPHIVVVQTEDVELFRELAKDGVKLLTTAEVLPASVEQGRAVAARRARRYGRRVFKFCSSLNKRCGWCPWTRYAGWQIQQISKLQAAAEGGYDICVVLDSDLLITRPFDLSLFAPEGRVTVFESFGVTPRSPGLSWKWHTSACHLLKQPVDPNLPANGYWAPPFVFDRLTVQALHRWLEAEYQRSWYEVLLGQPLSGWSEGATYTMFAHAHGDDSRLTFKSNPHLRGLYSTEHRQNPDKAITEALSDPDVFFIFIQSDQREQRRWPVELYEPILSRYFGGLRSSRAA